MSLAETITRLYPGESLRTALETETALRLLAHPQVVEFPLLGSDQVGEHEIENGSFSFHDSAEGLVLMIETLSDVITLYPNDTLVRRARTKD